MRTFACDRIKTIDITDETFMITLFSWSF
ncbi:hypothetical protein [Desulfobacula sp.]